VNLVGQPYGRNETQSFAQDHVSEVAWLRADGCANRQILFSSVNAFIARRASESVSFRGYPVAGGCERYFKGDEISGATRRNDYDLVVLSSGSWVRLPLTLSLSSLLGWWLRFSLS
jgi:hypothetical protein